MCDAAMPVAWLKEGVSELWLSCETARLNSYRLRIAQWPDQVLSQVLVCRRLGGVSAPWRDGIAPRVARSFAGYRKSARLDSFQGDRGGNRYSGMAKITSTSSTSTPMNHAERPLFVTIAAVTVAMRIITTAPGQNCMLIGVGPMA